MLRDPLPPYIDGEHPWQRGLTLMQGAINGVDCWGEFDRPGFGRTVQDEMSINQGPLSLSIATGNTWYEGDRPLMSDRRWYRLFDTNRDAVILDILFTVITDHGPVTIGSTKEGGFLNIRVNPTMNASENGRMFNSYGANDEIGCWSRRAQWMDYYAWLYPTAKQKVKPGDTAVYFFRPQVFMTRSAHIATITGVSNGNPVVQSIYDRSNNLIHL